MAVKQLSAGGYIASKCSKCKDTTNHTIVAMVGDRVARVECNTCGSIHNYRNTTVKKAAAGSKAGNSKPARSNRTEAEWEDQLKDADPAEAIPYSMQVLIKSGDLIQHPNFGLGRVIGIIRPNKMEVIFRDGLKLLRCSLAGS